MKLAKFASSALLFIAGTAQATVITFDDFSSIDGLTLNGNAHIHDNKLRLTNNQNSQKGSVFSTQLIDLNAGSFSTEFSFNFNGQNGGGADGIVFALQSTSNQAGSGGGGIGYSGLNNSFGLEFDNHSNGPIDNFSDSHIGINFNGSVVSEKIITTNDLGLGNLDSPDTVWYAWVNYDNSTDMLDVYFNDSDILPTVAAISYQADLPSILGTSQVYAGFTSATGGANANHDLLSWEFSGTSGGTSSFKVPEPSTVFIFTAGLFGLLRLTSRR
ncbi:lectin-like domain-containing protein [Flocculibacter collagenilyticus]|uniref:lectin-like domain-containing protein n=1 Tax=Flocculibacter collagenilyticus TaxID=2744479 RepID=UPI0018F52F04|nr:PEP-CTERM sorting domain-containing protein [Flocculibacter collagenilyticus]